MTTTTPTPEQLEAVALFDAMFADLPEDHARRVVTHDPAVRRMENLVADAAWGLADQPEFADCPACDEEMSYCRDEVGKQNICLECGFRYTDREAANDARLAEMFRDALIADGRWPLTPRIGPAIAATRTTGEDETRESAEVA